MTATASKTDWLADARASAWEQFGKTPAPAGDVETWRRLPYAEWKLESLDGAEPVPFRLPPDALEAARRAGAEVMSLEEAAESRPGAVRARLEAPSVSPDFRRHETANLALWRGGIYLRVPKGVTLSEPVRIPVPHDPGGAYQFPRVLVDVEEGAEAVIVEEHYAAPGEAAPLLSSSAFSDVRVGRGARLRCFYTQELPKTAVHFWHQRVELAQDASLDHHSILLGGRRHKSELDVVLAGPGAQSELRGALFGSGNQLFDPHTRQDHRARNTRSDLDFRAALRDKSRSIYTGLIRIERDAPDCEAYQQNRNLVLSDTARADSTPVLEILPDRVKCKHGATAGPLRQDELFYLRSRGLPEREAVQMLVMGFFEPVLAALPFEDLRERLTAAVGREVEAV